MDKEAKAQAPTPSINAPTSTTAALAEDVEKLQDTMQMPLTLTIAYIGFLYWWAETPADQWIATQETKADALGEPVFDPLNIWWGPPIFFTGFYLATIFLGTRYMEDKPPMKLKSAMLAYNLYQVVLNIWCVWRFVQIAIPKPFWNTPIDRSEKGFDVAFLIWIHYNNKYLELFDTFFMVFRKKNKQVSFLHVYHHVLLIWSWFAVVKYFPGGEAYFGACCNSFIHVCMYGYYLGASLGIPCPWKKYLTMLQLGQFVVCFTHACMCWVRGLVPGWLCALQLWVMSNMLVLFTNFYMKQYSAKKAGKADKGKGKQDKQDSKQDALTLVQQLVTAADSKKSAKSLRFTVVKGEVYEVSNFLQVHPGGEHLLSLALGRDATILFQSYHIRDSVVEAQLKQWKAPEGVTVELLRTAGLLNGVIASAEDHTEHKFPLPGDSAMYKTLKARVAKEVLTGSADKSGARGGQDWQTALILGTWIACWYMYVTSPSVFTGVLLGLAAAWCGLAVQHTANHGALFQSPDLNVLFGMADDITCGGSSVVWRYHHQLSHHLYTNHIELDQDAHSSFPLLRMDRTQPYKSFHKWQPFYAPIAFALYYFSVQMGDFETVMSKKVFRVRLTGVDKTGVKLSGISAIGEVPLFYIGKAIHFSLLLFIPFYYSGFQWTVTLPAFFAYTSTGSFVLSMLFIVSHNVLGTKEIDTVAATNDSTPAGKTVDPRKDWAAWQIDTSASWGGAIGGFFTGGLNLQIEHHLFPGVAHQHYPAIAKIVKEECANHGLPYHGYDNLALIVVDYFKFMAEMGTPPKGWAANAKKEKKQA